jgi:hypothetical protein
MTEPLPPVAPRFVVRVWSPLAVALYSFFMTYPAGLLLAVRNWRALGLRGRVLPHVAGAVLLTLLLVGIVAFAPSRVRKTLTLTMSGIVFVYLKERLRSDLADFAAAHPDVRVETRPWYSAFGWGLLGIVLLLAMALPPALIVSVIKVVLEG